MNVPSFGARLTPEGLFLDSPAGMRRCIPASICFVSAVVEL